MPVSTHQANPFSGTNFKIDTIKKFLPGKTFLQVFCSYHKIASRSYLTRHCRFKLSLHPRSGQAQEAPSKGAGISNIETMNFEMMLPSFRIKKDRAQRYNTSIFYIPWSIFDISLFNFHRIGRTFPGPPPEVEVFNQNNCRLKISTCNHSGQSGILKQR